MNEHTPGPWTVGGAYDNDGLPEIVIDHTDGNGSVAVAVAIGGLVGQKANASLIAAAPDMLEALQMITDALYVTEPDGEYRLKESFDELVMQRAIAKASGSAS